LKLKSYSTTNESSMGARRKYSPCLSIWISFFFIKLNDVILASSAPRINIIVIKLTLQLIVRNILIIKVLIIIKHFKWKISIKISKTKSLI
jgi:hypothetical protein